MLWGYTPAECDPYLKHRGREILFREAVLAFLGAGEKSPEDKYCEACRALGEADCKHCTKEIEVIDNHA